MSCLRARSHRAALVVTLLSLAASTPAAVVERRAEYLDAFVEFDASSGQWTIGNDAVRYSVRLERRGAVRFEGLSIGDARDSVTLSDEPDALVTLDGETVHLGAVGSGFVLEQVEPSIGTYFVAMALRFLAADRGLAATRHHVAYPAAAAIEMWTEIETLDHERRAVQNLNAFAMSIPPGAIDYVLGPKQQAPTAVHLRITCGRFRMRSGSSSARLRSQLNGRCHTSASATRIGGCLQGFCGPGPGRLRSIGAATNCRCRWDCRQCRPGRRLDDQSKGPTRWSVSHGMSLVRTSPQSPVWYAGRAGRAFPSWTTFNGWFVRGINIDEATSQSDIDLAADIGLEMFQLDAGWYPRKQPAHLFDFTDGLGSWQVDRDRFPSGLASLAEHARGRGLRFDSGSSPNASRYKRSDIPGSRRNDFWLSRTARTNLASPTRPHAMRRSVWPMRRRVHGSCKGRAACRGGPSGQSEVGFQSMGPLHARRS